jgi:hypothetical protein
MPHIGFYLRQRDPPDIPSPHKTRYRKGRHGKRKSRCCIRPCLLVGLIWVGALFLEALELLITFTIVLRGRGLGDSTIAHHWITVAWPESDGLDGDL